MDELAEAEASMLQPPRDSRHVLPATDKEVTSSSFACLAKLMLLVLLAKRGMVNARASDWQSPKRKLASPPQHWQARLRPNRS